MGKKKSTQTNTYQYMKPPETADTTALRGMKASVDPTIPFAFAKQREQLGNSYQNPLGSATSPATMEAMSRATNQAMSQNEAAANQASQFQADNANFGRQSAIAGMTAPQLVQTGGTMTQSGDIFGQLLGAGSQLGSAALM